jgi:hypothetical protein
LMNRPRRNWNAHAECQPDEGKQTQEGGDGVIHGYFTRRCRKNEQLISRN